MVSWLTTPPSSPNNITIPQQQSLSHLNDNQKRAVTHDPADGALLVIAGPGSGKTRVIVDRVKYLVSHYQVKPSQILCLTFSDKAAEEMRMRIEKEANTAEVETSTFHSFCLGILEESILDTGVSFKSGLISRANQLVWGLKNIDSFGFEHIEVGNNASHVIEALIDGISAFRDEIVSPPKLKEFIDRKRLEYEAERQALQATPGQKEKVPSGKLGAAKSRTRKINIGAQDDLEEKIAFVNKLSDLHKVYERYEQHKRQSSLIDYDDMIHIVIETFKRKQDVLRRYQERYAHVLVDEFQDNNYAQLELVKLLCPHGNVTAVGDDDQSIYRFRGAFDSIFGDFQESYKDNITMVKLERNYRSTRQIVGLAKKLLDPVPNRIQKSLYSENEDGNRTVVARCATDLAEIDFVVNKIRNELVGREITKRDGTAGKIAYRDIAILSRRRLEGLKFAKALKAHGIPCTYVGESRIFSMPVVRDMLAYLRVAADPLDNGIEITRILLTHGVPEQDIKIINHAAKAKARELVRRLDNDGNGNDKYSSRADDTDNNRNYGTDFVYDVMEEIASSSSSGNSISGQLRTKPLVVDVYNQIKKIVSLRDKRTIGQFVHEVLMSHTDIYKRTIKDDSNESTRDRLVLHEFLDIVREFESTTKNGLLNDLLAHIDMMSDFDIELRHGQDDLDSVIVTTIHQSKGREFPIVFVVDVADKRLPVTFKEKKFYCPSELAHGLRNRDKDEKEIFIEEERRLLYVAMTRAQHQLFLTLAEIYGDNTTKTKASQFLLELDVDNNPLVNLVTYDVEGQAPPLVVAEDRIEQVKHEYQLLATKFVSQMQLKSAIEKIVELAMIEHVRLGKPLDAFELKEMIAGIVVDRARVEAQLREERATLIDKDKIHFSASALKTYKDCPLKYKFQYVLEVPSGGKSYFDLGSAVHSVVEVLTRRQIEEQGYVPTKDDAINILDYYWVSSSYQSITAEQEDRAHAERMLEFFAMWCAERKGMGCTPFAAEKDFEIEVAGKKVIGFIDRIDLTPSGNYEVFDYKTGKSTLNGNTIRSDIQMNLYSLAIEKLYGKLPQSANLLYLRKEKKLSYDAKQDSVTKSKEQMVSLIDGILNERFDPMPDFNTCRFCDYQSICDAKEIEED
jgi:DNA helicase II / ATP-dependent DNA helicase PcrA